MELTHGGWRGLPLPMSPLSLGKCLQNRGTLSEISPPPFQTLVAVAAVVVAKPSFSVDIFQTPVRVNRSTIYSIAGHCQIVLYGFLCVCLNVLEELSLRQ